MKSSYDGVATASGMSCDLPPVCGTSVQFEPGMAGYGRPYLPDAIELRLGHRPRRVLGRFPARHV